MQRARTEEAKDERRRALLNAALETFFEKGFKAARMADIAERAGFTKGTLYLYFESKEDLFKELITTIALPNVQRLEGLLAGSESAAEGIRAFLGLAIRIVSETQLPKFIKVLIADAGVFPDVIVMYREQVLDRVFAAIARLLAKGQESGELKMDDPVLTARLVAAPILFSAIWHVVFETKDKAPLDLKNLFSLHGSILISALSKDKEEI